MSTVTATPTAVRRLRPALVSAVLAVASVTVAVLVLWQPWGERDALGYDDLAPHADAAWLGSLVDGLAVAAIGVTLGLAVCRLVTARGATLATVAALLAGAGGVAFSAGMITYASLAWYVTNPEAVPAAQGRALMSYVESHPGHALGPQMAGFLLFTLGSLGLMGALWRARAVPRWLPVTYVVLTAGLFVLDGVALNVVQAAQTLSLLVVAYQAWSRTGSQV